MQLVATDAVTAKISREHGVSIVEVEEALFNHGGGPVLVDDREVNRTRPATVWFIAETFDGRLLKVVVIPLRAEGVLVLRTAYEPDEAEIAIYEANT
jgi:hypothetical protein